MVLVSGQGCRGSLYAFKTRLQKWGSMRTTEEMRQILTELDTKLDDFTIWKPEALELLHNWLDETRVWTEEGIIFHDDPKNGD